MSNLFRQSLNGAPQPPPPRPKPNPISVSGETDDYALSSGSSSSSADSAASVNTVRPSSREQQASPNHWTNYFDRELFLDDDNDGKQQVARYHVYLTSPLDPRKGPLFICHHGAGASGLSLAVFARYIRMKLPGAGIISLEARAHGSVVRTKTMSSAEEHKQANGNVVTDFGIETLASDALTMINLTKQQEGWPTLPPSILVGHSLGGAVVTAIAASGTLGSSLVGSCVLDVVEGSALEALTHMKTYLSSRPSTFGSVQEGIDWHARTRTIRNQESAQVSVPSLLTPTESGRYVWKTDLGSTAPWWEDWFNGMSKKFLAGKCAKMLMLAGTDRLDKDLMIGQMQGKFQLVVLPEAGHFIREDVPERAAELLVEFFRRNDRSAMVLPPKVSDLIAQGKRV